MAIGDGNFNNSDSGSNNKGLYERTYYSRLRFRNDKLGISINYRSGLLILEMNQADQNYKITPIISIYLSPMKAHLLSEEIKKFKKYLASDNIKENVAFGVNAGMGEKVSYIGLHTNKDKDIFVTIGKFDDKGQIIESHTFQFQKDYHYALEWKDISKMDIEKATYNDAELDIFHNLITDFSRSMNGTYAYAAADLTRYDHQRILGKMDPIYDKLGIERRTGSNNYGNRDNNFLSNASVSSRSTSIDEMEDLLSD